MSDRFSLESKNHTNPISIPYSGQSMNPSFQEGDKLIVENDLNALEQGDILFFKDLVANEFVVHRLVQKNEMKIKGDYSLSFDHDEIKLYGKVIGFCRKNKKVYWGSKGQKFKKTLALFSNYRTGKKIIRRTSLIMIYLFTFLSSLFYSKTTINHT